LNTPETAAADGRVRETVIDAIDKLPDDLRTAITLREVEGMSYEEIATVMECPNRDCSIENLQGARGHRHPPEAITGRVRRRDDYAIRTPVGTAG
jgi:hypothetical protein